MPIEKRNRRAFFASSLGTLLAGGFSTSFLPDASAGPYGEWLRRKRYCSVPVSHCLPACNTGASSEVGISTYQQLVARLNGSDGRFHRRSGRARGNYWVDTFDTSNPASPILQIGNRRDMLDLAGGTYRLKWDAHLTFRNRACRLADDRYAAIGAGVTRQGSGNGHPFILYENHSETYVCARRQGLVYREGFETTFSVSGRQNDVSFAFYAWNDENSGRPGYTNIVEVEIRSMQLWRL